MDDKKRVKESKKKQFKKIKKIMLHFGNSLTAEEIIKDEIDFNSTPCEYIGTRVRTEKTGHYNEAKEFIQTGTREIKSIYTATKIKNQWFVSNENGDGGHFDNIDQIKRRINYIDGKGFKWKVTKRK